MIGRAIKNLMRAVRGPKGLQLRDIWPTLGTQVGVNTRRGDDKHRSHTKHGPGRTHAQGGR